MKKTYMQVISLLLIDLILLFPISLAESIGIMNVSVSGITDNSAEVGWLTDLTSSSRVNYGKTIPLTEKASDSSLLKNHSVRLSELDAASTYLFEVYSMVGDDEETDNNNGSYYQFTTEPDLMPMIDVDIPDYHNGLTISLSIKTDPDSIVDVIVNNGYGYWVRDYAGDDGYFNVDVDLDEGSNVITIKAEDPRGNANETQHEVIVDMTIPVITVNLSQIPDQTENKKLYVNGSVSENVTLTISLGYTSPDTIYPEKVTGLRYLVVEDNSVEIDWNKSTADDFKEYLIYRDSKRITSRTTNSFADQVNTSTAYTYEVSAVDENCNEGERSDPLTITTLAGSNNVSVSLAEFELECEQEQELVVQTEDAFSVEFGMDEDGFYLLRLEASDPAGNSDVVEKNIYFDTEAPEITDIDPKDGTDIFEQFADDVTITGRTDPYAKVYLYVKRTPLGEWNDSIMEKLDDEIGLISEEDLSVDSSCDCRADYETVADESGFFSFEGVDVTSSLVLGSAVGNVYDYEDLSDVDYFDSLRDRSMESNLLFIATDAYGRRGHQEITYDVQTCWYGDRLWDATPLLQYQSPAFISSERLVEGTETLYFYFNFSYYGDLENDEPYIVGVNIEKACDDYIMKEPSYNHSCQVMRSSPTEKVIGGNTVYVIWKLSAYEEMDKWLGDEWEDFYDSLTNNQMIFPMKLTVNYKYKNENKTYVSGTQTFCDSVAYYVDVGRVDPRKVLPDWLLYDFVDTLDEIINTTTKWIEKLDKIMEYAAIGCVVSYFVMFLTKFVRNFKCRLANIQKLTDSGVFGANIDGKCKECMQNFDKLDTTKRWDMDDLSDTCLRECYPECYSGWQFESTWYSLFRWTCDRLFGHSAPAKWTGEATDDELLEKARMATQCTNDQSTQGRPLKAVNCRSVENDYPGLAGSFGVNDNCIEIYSTDKGTKEKDLYRIGASVGNYVYEIKRVKGTSTVEYSHAIKQSENSYLTFQPETCAELCGVAGGTQGSPIVNIGKDDVRIDEKKVAKSDQREALCSTPNECNSLYKREYKKIEEVTYTVTKGYTSDCFYMQKSNSLSVTAGHNLEDTEVVSGDPDKRMECCCLYGLGEKPETKYYVPSDVESKRNKNKPYGAGLSHAGEGITGIGKQYEDMVWSYRYYNIKWVAPESREKGAVVRDQYNPNRYISGRDFSACFGQNHWLSKDQLALNPTTDHWATLQCADISGVYNRLVFIRNLATMLKSCLIQVRTTGKADSGVCKELFTQYICSFIWKILVWIRDGCSPFGSLSEMESAGWERYIVAGTGALLDSVKESQTQMRDEYGNADLNNLLGMGEEAIVRKICLAAFGYDWDLSLEDFMDVAYSSPFATFVQAVLPSREYLTFDPTTSPAKSVYEYRASWTINPGCNFDDYTVYLSCASSNEISNYDDIRCDKVGSPQKPDCACEGKDKEVTRLLYDGDSLTQNVLEDVDHTMISSGNRIVTSEYRYDHLKFVIDARNIKAADGDVERCFPEGHVEGSEGIFYFPIKDYTPSDLASCYVDPETGVFDCSAGASFLQPFGDAYITDITLSPGDQKIDLDSLGTSDEEGADYRPDERISGKITYYKDEKRKCVVIRLLEKNKGIIAESQSAHDLGTGAETDTMSFTLNKEISQSDVSTSETTYSVSIVDSGGEGISKGLTISSIDSGSFEAGKTAEVIIEFIDKDGNGIKLEDNSKDEFRVDSGSSVSVGDVCNENNFCEFDFAGYGSINIKAVITNVNMEDATADKRKFTITFTKATEATLTSMEPSYYLYIDMRNPLEDRDSCTGIESQNYDESQIVVSSGKKERYYIPIFVLAHERGNKCSSEYGYISDTQPCVCTTESSVAEDAPTDCPVEKDNYYYCVDGECRRYPKCKISGTVSECVCGEPDYVDKNNYNCGFKENSEDDFDKSSIDGFDGLDVKEKEKYKYCYKADGDEEEKCHNNSYTATVEDNTDPTISKIVFLYSGDDSILGQVEEVNPQPKDVDNNKKIEFRVTAYDSDSGINRIELIIDGDYDNPKDKKANVESGKDYYKLEWTPIADASGYPYNVEIQVVNNAGRKTKWPTDGKKTFEVQV